MKRLLVLTLAASLTAAAALAQEGALAPKQAEAAKWIASCNESALGMPCATFVAAFRGRFPELSTVTDAAKLASYVERLDPVPCAQFDAALPAEALCLYDPGPKAWILTVTDSAVTLAPSGQTGRRPRGRAFTRDTFSSRKEYAELIRDCDKGVLNLSCSELVNSFNRAFGNDIEDVANKDQLANFIENDTVEKPCPLVETRIARVVQGKADLEYRRRLREGEMCLYHNSSGRYISSMSCGQWIPDSLPVFTASNKEIPATPQPETPIADAVRKTAEQIETPPQPEMAREPEEPKGPAWWSFKRTSGKALWGSVIAGAVVCGFKCRVTNVNETNVYIH